MEDFFQKVTSQQDPFKKLASFIPGFKGYIERQNRRDADKVLRDTVARRFEDQWRRASQLQSDMVSNGQIAFVDDIEKAAIKLRTFIDKISTAPARLFRHVRVRSRSTKGTRIHLSVRRGVLRLAEQVGRGLDNGKPAWATPPHSRLPFGILHLCAAGSGDI